MFNLPISYPELLAAAGIAPCVVIRTVGVKTANITTAATQEPIGITEQWSYDPPGTTGASANVVPTGKPIPYKGRLQVAKALVGAGGVTGGTRVMSNASGGVIAHTTSGAINWSVGYALESGTEGEYVDVWVDPMVHPST